LFIPLQPVGTWADVPEERSTVHERLDEQIERKVREASTMRSGSVVSL
jgi:hypothetical protein